MPELKETEKVDIYLDLGEDVVAIKCDHQCLEEFEIRNLTKHYWN